MKRISARSNRALKKTSAPDFSLEAGLIAVGHKWIAGIDEAGRGPLAGPVAAAAVIFDPDRIPQGLNDSKVLSGTRREALFDEILSCAVAAGIGLSPAEEIDRINIRQATFAAMRRAASALSIAPDHALIDGRDVPPGLSCPGTAIIKGDGLSVSIAAASILAKVTRDRLMARLDLAYPAYGFAVHAGYPTKTHRKVITDIGPCHFHRLSFGSLKNI